MSGGARPAITQHIVPVGFITDGAHLIDDSDTVGVRTANDVSLVAIITVLAILIIIIVSACSVVKFLRGALRRGEELGVDPRLH
jgi:hypothetical protein